MGNNKNTIVSSFFWSFLQTFATQFVGVIITTFLARLILPKDYGIIAAANIFIGFATTFVAGGFSNALIQKKDADEKDYSTMFAFNILFSLAIYLMVFFAAPAFVDIFNKSYDKALLVKLIRVLGIGVFFSSFNAFFRSILQKKLQFKKLFQISLILSIVSGSIGIFLAYNGFGVWALVAQNLISYIGSSIFLIIFSKWKFKLYFSFERFKPMFSYGLKMMLSGLLITIYADITSLVVGNKYESDLLAYYNKGVTYPKLIALNIITSMNTVLFPVMAKIQDVEEIKRLVRKFNRISAFIITPMMFGFAAVAPTFVEFLLGKNWLPAVSFLQICCFNYAIQPIAISSLQYLRASGKAGEYLMLDVIRKVIGVILLVLAILVNKGVYIIVFSEVATNFLAIFINLYPGKKHLNYLVREQFLDIVPKFALSLIMFIAVMAIGTISSSLIVKLFLQVFAGIIIYGLLAFLLRFKELKEVLQIAKRLLIKN